ELHDRRREFEQAFGHFEAANRLCRTDFDPDNHRQLGDRIVSAYNKADFSALPRSSETSSLPVFIVGLPRSGTTLVEQIISSHPRAAGAGELALIRLQAFALPQMLGSDTPYPECVNEADNKLLDRLASQYLERLTAAGTDVDRITDKMWQNYENLGFARLLLPQARIIHCRRDPRDALLSCYFQLFGLGGIPFSYDRDNLLTAYQVYRQLMEHWRDTLSIPMLEIDYESLVDDPDAQIRRLIDYIDLPWDDGCLEFYRNRRGVATASYDQVRQPIYTESVRRHDNYRPWLGEWFDSIDAS
ncbi:MAG: sulfotransferase, partial [Gammaproteobacteria bacterium]|nr:sulfotransferase [Gammaproteobacteria bacterium]